MCKHHVLSVFVVAAPVVDGDVTISIKDELMQKFGVNVDIEGDMVVLLHFILQENTENARDNLSIAMNWTLNPRETRQSTK